MSKRLSIAAALVDDGSRVSLEKSAMRAMGVAHGDVVLLTRGGRKTVALAHMDESDEAQPGVARVSTIMRRNLHLDIDDAVTVTALGDVPTGKCIRVCPIDDTVDEGMLGEKLFENYLQPHFADSFRPVQQGDLFLVRSQQKGGAEVEFVVVETDPKPYCIVGPKTDILYNGTPIPRHEVL